MLLIPLTIRGILDVFITRNDLPNPDLFVHAPSISNHSLIEGHLPIQPENVFETFTTCSWRKFDITKFKQDLFTSNFFSQDSNWANFTIVELFSNYNLTLRTLLDKHLPVRKMTRRVDPLTPWFDADCVRAKRNVRRLERLYHHTSFMSDRIKWVEVIRAMHALFNAKERAFWEKRIESVAGDSKKCWRAMNKLMRKTSNSKIPDGFTAEAFSRFFAQKIKAVRAARGRAHII